jgi:plasmid stability protein
MATLYVENFDDELYEALRKEAKKRRSSIAAEITAMVKHHFPTEAELAARHAYFKKLSRIHAKPAPKGVELKSTEEELREDRSR